MVSSFVHALRVFRIIVISSETIRYMIKADGVLTLSLFDAVCSNQLLFNLLIFVFDRF